MKRRPRPAPVLLRQVPGDTVVHRLWAGTKLLSVVAYGVVLSLVPSWSGIAIGAAICLGAARLAHVPLRAVPRLPPWLGVVVLLGGALTLASGGTPEVAVGSGHVGLGHLELYVRFTCLSIVLLGASALLAWTTPLGEVAPAVARIGAPLRRLRLPVDEWAVTTALCIRSLPMVVEEMRTVVAARRLRPRPAGPRNLDAALDGAIDLLVAVLAASIRRAGEMGEAITARGGAGQLTARRLGPRRADAVTFAVVGAACVAAVAIPTL